MLEPSKHTSHQKRKKHKTQTQSVVVIVVVCVSGIGRAPNGFKSSTLFSLDLFTSYCHLYDDYYLHKVTYSHTHTTYTMPQEHHFINRVFVQFMGQHVKLDTKNNRSELLCKIELSSFKFLLRVCFLSMTESRALESAFPKYLDCKCNFTIHTFIMFRLSCYSLAFLFSKSVLELFKSGQFRAFQIHNKKHFVCRLMELLLSLY